MNLLDLRTEVLAHEVNASVDRVNAFLNNGLRNLARRVNFWAESAQQTITTVAGQASYPWPDDFGRARYLRDTDPSSPHTLKAVRLRDIDESVVSTGRPYFFAVDGPAMLLYVTPDQEYDLELRYWKLPPLLVEDTDIPAIPDDYHRTLVYYALQRAYESEDDMEMGQYWAGQWAQGLREMANDVKFPLTDSPRRIRDMWGQDDRQLTPGWMRW